jgi:hypothetical protein
MKIFDKMANAAPAKKPAEYDPESLKQGILDWLAEIKMPAFPEAKSWEDHLQVFRPRDDQEAGDPRFEMRLAVRLYTQWNQYLLSILESHDEAGKPVYAATTHVNWESKDKRLHKVLAEGYTGGFSGGLLAKHIIWAQTFRVGELVDALNCCAVAILGQELVGEPPGDADGEPVTRPHPKPTSFPPPDA